jgi:hypothetical protein
MEEHFFKSNPKQILLEYTKITRDCKTIIHIFENNQWTNKEKKLIQNNIKKILKVQIRIFIIANSPLAHKTIPLKLKKNEKELVLQKQKKLQNVSIIIGKEFNLQKYQKNCPSTENFKIYLFFYHLQTILIEIYKILKNLQSNLFNLDQFFYIYKTICIFLSMMNDFLENPLHKINDIYNHMSDFSNRKITPIYNIIKNIYKDKKTSDKL